MRILLVGEYSRLHNTLKDGLLHLGHEVLLIGTGDGFKKFPVDIDHSSKIFSKPFFRPFVKSIEFLTSINLIQLEHGWRFYSALRKLRDFDVIQLVNENSIRTHPPLEIWLLKKLMKQNGKLYLLSCGTDYLSVRYAYDKKYRYSILSPLFDNSELRKNYRFILKYLRKPYLKLHQFLFRHIHGVIASDIDYHLPLEGNPKYVGLIPNPIHIDSLSYEPLRLNGKIRIFHGVNSMNYLKKGNRFFDEALSIIQKKYAEKIEVISTRDLPYSEYIKAYDQCHILLDQVYAYDQGYNALEAMAKGKVVFTGAEQEWLDHYGLEKNAVAINALPDVSSIVNNLETLIQNPEIIIRISENARAFIKKEHDHIDCAQKYLRAWQN